MRYVDNWNLFGLDIMNECHDHASWGKGDPLTDFNRYVERFMLFVNEKVPQFRGLFFVEGVSERRSDEAKTNCGLWIVHMVFALVCRPNSFNFLPLLIFLRTSSPPAFHRFSSTAWGKYQGKEREGGRKGGREMGDLGREIGREGGREGGRDSYIINQKQYN